MAVAGIWKESFRVRSYETDPNGCASVATVCNYLQEAAGNHAFKLGVSVDQLHEQRLTWVLTRLRVHIDAFPKWRDDVMVETWPSGVEGLFATRDFLLLDDAGRHLGRATSGWMMIDLERRRPVRMPEIITSIEPPDRVRAVPELSSRLPEPASETETGPTSVRYGDLDVNGHVNNVRYMEWALDAMDVEQRASSRLRELEIHFKAEAVLGDRVNVLAGVIVDERHDRRDDPPEAAFAHMIMQSTSRKELARLRTVWTPG